MGEKGKVLNPFIHARKRPDTYIGSIQTVKKDIWIFETDEDGTDRIVQKTIRYNSGLERIIVEIMSNAIDNKWRSEKHEVPMKSIKFDIDKESGTISITNDGYFIPAIKEEYEFEDFTGKVSTASLYPAEVFFGQMLAGTNFEDDEARKTSGRNGMGAKAANVFSTKFIVEHADPENGKKFVQIYTEAGRKRSKPEITNYKSKTGYTKITFTPDYEFFAYPSEASPGMDDNLFQLIKRHAAECAMITQLSVSFNDEKIKVKDLISYAKMYYPDSEYMPFKSSYGDDCVLVQRDTSELGSDVVENISFVNGIHTSQGGVHVEAWRSEIIGGIMAEFNGRKTKKKQTQLKTTAKQLHPYFVLFVRCEVDKPSFATQTKECFTGIKDGNKFIDYVLYDKNDKKKKDAWKKMIDSALKKIMKWDFVKDLEDKLAMLMESKSTKTLKKSINLGSKGTHANWYKKKDKKCGLIITEGDSARTTADRGRTSLEHGVDLLGSLAIRGKFINVQTHSLKQVCDNKEVQLLMNMIHLRFGVDYSDDAEFETLNYKYVWVMADADDDGIHIRGLLANFFHKFWPALYDRKFFNCFGTAVVKLFPKKKSEGVIMFFSNKDFEEWKEQNADEMNKSGEFKNYKCKYYKGLATLLPHEMPEYFNDPKLLELFLDGDERTFMELGFNNKQENRDDRKKWITKTLPKPVDMYGYDGVVDENEENTEAEYLYEGKLSLSHFVDHQLIIYHKMCLERALPRMMDGMKKSQRECLYAITNAKLKEEADIEKLAGIVKTVTKYHHGAASLYGTIFNMGQGIVGTNNIPLFQNKGEFGSRFSGGDDAGQPRYAHTCVDPIAKAIFVPDDEPLLKQVNCDGTLVEYETYYPCIPMVLVNGASGIACGFSTEVPCYNPEDLVKWITLWLDSEDGTVNMPDLKPWYRGFTGEIELVPDTKEFYKAYTTRGILEKVDKAGKTKKTSKKGSGGDWWHVRELPIGLWTNNFKEYLEFLESGEPPAGSRKAKSKETYIKNIQHYSTANSVSIKFQAKPHFIPDIDVKGNMTVLKNSLSLKNMVVLDENGYPRRYKCPEHLLHDFCKRRLVVYEERREYYLKLYKKELKKETSRCKYVKAVAVEKTLDLYQEDDALKADLDKMKLEKCEDSRGPYDYLLSMQTRSLTKKKVEELEKEIGNIKAKIDVLEKKTGQDLWKEDLTNFLSAYQVFLKTRVEEVKIKKGKKKSVLEE